MSGRAGFKLGGCCSGLEPSLQSPRAPCSMTATWDLPLEVTQGLLNVSLSSNPSCLLSLPLVLPNTAPHQQPGPTLSSVPAKPLLNGGRSRDKAQLPNTEAPTSPHPASLHFHTHSSSLDSSHTYLTSRYEDVELILGLACSLPADGMSHLR